MFLCEYLTQFKTNTLRILLTIYIILLAACASNKALNNVQQASALQPYIDSITNTYAPDQRVVLFTDYKKNNYLG